MNGLYLPAIPPSAQFFFNILPSLAPCTSDLDGQTLGFIRLQFIVIEPFYQFREPSTEMCRISLEKRKPTEKMSWADVQSIGNIGACDSSTTVCLRDTAFFSCRARKLQAWINFPHCDR